MGLGKIASPIYSLPNRKAYLVFHFVWTNVHKVPSQYPTGPTSRISSSLQSSRGIIFDRSHRVSL